MIRAFIAVKIEPTPEIRRLLTKLNTIGGNVRPVAPDKLHVTLKFLGDTEESLLPEIKAALSATVQGKQACDVKLVGVGAFPNVKRPAVIWIGLHDAEPLCELAVELENRLEPFGFARERREFQPHLTLTRLRSRPPEAMFALFSEHSATPYGNARINSVELMRSELLPGGSRYTVLARAPLAGFEGDY